VGRRGKGKEKGDVEWKRAERGRRVRGEERESGVNSEVGKVTLKSNGDEALSNEFLLKVTVMKH
jgi:hypothetical protein